MIQSDAFGWLDIGAFADRRNRLAYPKFVKSFLEWLSPLSSTNVETLLSKNVLHGRIKGNSSTECHLLTLYGKQLIGVGR
jgi:hypothetical protein